MPQANTEPLQPPGANWDNASHAKVEEIGAPPEVPPPDVPILQIFFTPADIEIHEVEYPDGVVIVNENPRPHNRDPHIADDQPIPYQYIKVPHHKNSIHVHISDNIGWPCGKVVKFEKIGIG